MIYRVLEEELDKFVEGLVSQMGLQQSSAPSRRTDYIETYYVETEDGSWETWHKDAKGNYHHDSSQGQFLVLPPQYCLQPLTNAEQAEFLLCALP